MKFILVESFTNKYQSRIHYNNHAVGGDRYYPNDTEETYVKKAEDLANQYVDMFKIQGYKCKPDSRGRVRYVKWNRDTHDFVVYGRDEIGSEPIIISMYKVPPRQFAYRLNTDARIDGEIPYGM
jgi:hypothetical protein